MNMVHHISDEGIRFIKKWEEFVGHVYDDKIPRRRIKGKLQYPEWDGGKPRGTLTIGYGHTDAAGYPKITKGLRITEPEASEVLEDDSKDCVDAVNRHVKVPLTQYQFDALVSFTINCGAGNLKKLVVGLNKGDYDSIPRKLMLYVSSKGERMQGLVNRRAGEIQLWNKPSSQREEDAMPIPSTADKVDAPKAMIDSKTGNSAIIAGGAGTSVAISGTTEAISTAKDLKENAADLGIFDYFGIAIQSPIFWLGVIVLACTVFIYWDRHRKLEEEGV